MKPSKSTARGSKIDLNTQRRIMVNHAKTFAEADRSDPFAYNRALCHINNGIASVGLNGEDACYKAETYLETRHLPDGTPYEVTSYKNVQRP
jgi:hypothetical protein